MKRIAIAFCLLLFLALPLHAQEYDYVAGAGGAVISCSSGADDQSYATTTANSGSTLRGQSFQVNGTSYLYSITLDFYGNGTSSDALTLCVSTNINLGADCANAFAKKTETVSFENTVPKSVEFVFQNTTTQLTAGTTYYMALRSADAIVGQWYYHTSSGYANGTKYATTADDWDLTGHQDAQDFSFKIKVCQ